MNRALLAALVVIVGGALIAGFSAVGGPEYARMEQRDATRLSDLRRLGEYHACDAGRGAEGALDGRCAHWQAAPDLTDPLTGAPYRVELTGETTLKVCAEFETQMRPDNRYMQLELDGQTGCLRYTRAGAQDTTVIQD